MSVEAINWALSQPLKHSSTKFVLVVMANHADDQEWLSWPSVASIAESTGQDRKTVMENLKRLQVLGYLTDTGGRKGETKQVPIYRLNRVPVPLEQYQNRDSTENGTVPKTTDKSTDFPAKESRNSSERVPKTGHGTIKEPPKEPSGNQQEGAEKKSRAALGVSDLIVLGVDRQVAEDWLALRTKKRLPLTKTALAGILAEVDKAEMLLPAALKLCCARGWAGFNADWLMPRSNPPRASPGYQSATEKTKAWADRLTGRNRSHERDDQIIDINEPPSAGVG